VCSKCGEEKELNKDNFIWKKTYWEGRCRECFNISRRRNNNNTIKSEVEPEYKIIKSKKEGEYKSMNVFNDDEVKILKSLISKHNDIMSTINKRIVLEPTEKIKRVPKSLNIEIDIFNILQKHSKKTNISISDIVNKLLRESISDIE